MGAMKLPLVVLSFFAILLVYIASHYWTFDTEMMFLSVKQDLVSDPIWLPVFYVHVFSSCLCLLAAPIQFLNKLRIRKPQVHKLVGRIYAYSILLLAGPTGLYMAFYSEGGHLASLGFICMAFGWWWSTYAGVACAMRGDIWKHKEWMVMSFAFSYAAVTLRILVPLLSFSISGLSEDFITTITAWLSWIINALIAWLVISNNRKSRPLKLIRI